MAFRANAEQHRATARLLAAAAVTFVALVIAVSYARAGHLFPQSSFPYSKDSCGGTRVDPVGAKFNGSRAGSEGVARNVSVHANWTNDSGGDQYLSVLTGVSPDKYDCRNMGQQEANGGSSDARDHVRIWRIPYYDGATLKSAATPHSEYHDCGSHQIYDENANGESGYDIGRKLLKQGFYGTAHNTNTNFWHNTDVRWNACNDYFFSSTGYGAIIEINHDH